MTKLSLCLIAWMMPLSSASAGHTVWQQQDQWVASDAVSAEPSVWRHQAELSALDGEEGNRFSGNPMAIAIDGNTAVVGALSSGAAYVFVRRGGIWSEQARLQSDGVAEQFGWSVALSGDTALIGANIADSWHGAVYVFTRNGEEWSEQAKLSASDGGAFHTFGNSLALSGDTALIGSAGGLSALPGSVYVFTRDGDEWIEQAKLTAYDGHGGDHFGSAVALRDDVALIGARNAEVNGNSEQGAAYVFSFDGEVWSEQAKLTSSDGGADHRFGHMVALGDGTALIGAPAVQANNVQGGSRDDEAPGAAYIFSREGDEWAEEARLNADGKGADGFGYALSLAGDVAVVGAPMTDIGDNTGQGAAYLFTRNGEGWNGPTALNRPAPGADEWFGFGVASQDDTIMVGMPGKMVSGTPEIEGTVQVFGALGNALFSDRFEQE